MVDDYERWHDFISKALRDQPRLQIIGQVFDGLDAVQKAQQLEPDLILLDIGLPRLNGIEVARRIRKSSPNTKMLFLSENRSPAIVEEALSTGAGGYVLKSNAASDLLPAVWALLLGRQFVSAGLTGYGFKITRNDHAAETRHCHEMALYADENSVINGYARFIGSALKRGNAVIVVVTEAHRDGLLSRLKDDGVNVPAAIKQGNCILLDAGDVLSRLTVDAMPDPIRCTRVIGDLIMGAADGAKTESGRVVVCGEIAPTLLSGGYAEGAIQLENLWDKITRGYGVDTLCGYLSSAFPNNENSSIFGRICAIHSAVHGLGY